ncbi:MAG: 1-(5-phosphoribosyl)-5-[(5-phosphoribosylamino)methylideneamino]imidazole-4-carboxamide isomerase [Bacteroidota bacterium]
MKALRLIPAIDLIDGKCVRLEQGDYDKQKTYDKDPLDMAKELEDNGLTYLHMVDLDGAKQGKIVNWRILEKVCTHTSLQVDYGGGLKREKDVEIAFESGAIQVNIGSMAVKDPAALTRWLGIFGPEKIILSADVKGEKIAIHGWQDTSDFTVFDLIHRYLHAGLKYVVCTDISKDGMLQGPGLDIYRKIQSEFPQIELIASGGVTTLEDLDQLEEMQVNGAIIGKALYEGKLSLKELHAWT